MKRPNAYERAINKLRIDILTGGDKIRETLELSMDALVYQDKDKAFKVIEADKTIDEMNDNIEIRALELISIQQPLTEELRRLKGIMKIMDCLERVSDNSVNIAEISIKLSDKGEYFKPLVDIPKMAELSKDMVCNSLKAYSEEDTHLADSVIESDDEVDNIYSQLYEELLEFMKKDAEYVEQASYLSFVARYLERIGDQAVNIAEEVNFMVCGEKASQKNKCRMGLFCRE